MRKNRNPAHHTHPSKVQSPLKEQHFSGNPAYSYIYLEQTIRVQSMHYPLKPSLFPHQNATHTCNPSQYISFIPSSSPQSHQPPSRFTPPVKARAKATYASENDHDNDDGDEDATRREYMYVHGSEVMPVHSCSSSTTGCIVTQS